MLNIIDNINIRMRIKITLALTCLINLWSFTQPFTYNRIPSSWRFSSNSIPDPNHIICFKNGGFFLALDKENTFAVVQIASDGSYPVIRSPGNSKYHPDNSPRNDCTSGFEIEGTNYFLLGTSVSGRGISKIDTTSRPGYIFTNFGSSENNEKTNVILEVSDQLFVSGKEILFRDKSNGVILSPRVGLFASLLAKGLPSDPLNSFFYFDPNAKRVKMVGSLTKDSLTPTIYHSLTPLDDQIVTGLGYLGRHNLLLAYYNYRCVGIDLVSGEIVWSTVGMGSRYRFSNAVMDVVGKYDLFVLADTGNNEQMSIFQQNTTLTAPSIISAYDIHDDIISISSSKDGGIILVMNDERALSYERQGSCSSLCLSCNFNDDNDCLSCNEGYYLFDESTPKQCIQCDSFCRICQGPTSCSECSDGYQWEDLSSRCELISQPPPVQESSPSSSSPLQSCESEDMVFVETENSCVDCFEERSYTTHELCSIQNSTIYLYWNISQAFFGRRLDLLEVTVKLSDDYTNSSIKDALKHIPLSYYLADSMRLSFSISGRRITVEIHSNNSFLLKLNRKVEPDEKNLILTSSNLGLKSRSILLETVNGTRFVLLGKSETAPLPVVLSRNDQLDPKLIKYGQYVAYASKISLGAAAVFGILGSSCSLNFGPAFIKLFQIIEILGKFYFLPVKFSPIMDFFLEQVYSLTDFISADKNLIIGPQNFLANPYFNKFTTLNHDRFSLRMMPLQVLLYFSLCFVFFFLGFFKGVKVVDRILKAVGSIKNMIFHMSYVDFMFQSSFALTGIWVGVKNMRFAILLNYIISFYLLYECSILVANLVRMSFLNFGPNHHAVSFEDSLLNDGLKKNGKTQRKRVRFMNALSFFKIMLHQVILTTNQNEPVFCVLACLLLEVSFMTYFCYCWFEYEPFESFYILLEKFSFELCTTNFTISILLKITGAYHVYIDYLTIYLALLCILVQVWSALRSACITLISSFSKKQVGGKKPKTISRIHPQSAKINKQVSSQTNQRIGKRIKIVQYTANSKKILIATQTTVRKGSEDTNSLIPTEREASKKTFQKKSSSTRPWTSTFYPSKVPAPLRSNLA